LLRVLVCRGIRFFVFCIIDERCDPASCLFVICIARGPALTWNGESADAWWSKHKAELCPDLAPRVGEPKTIAIDGAPRLASVAAA